ncbi:MAG: hypothetical protein HY606_09380, partial [Planctomycetes bacterium]|nr:hypothetical protein [Planctomycetota bacterium]
MITRPVNLQKTCRLFFIWITICIGFTAQERQDWKAQYPKAKKGSNTDEYHGTTIKDPYRWLENLHAGETKKWVNQQIKLSEKHIEQGNLKQDIKTRLTELIETQRYQTPVKRQNRYFYIMSDGHENQPKMYVRDEESTDPEILVDPNQLSSDGSTALMYTSVSKDGNLLAYGLCTNGSDIFDIHIINTKNKKKYKEVIRNASLLTTIQWSPDSSGFFYNTHGVYWHKLGTTQSGDKLIFAPSEFGNWSSCLLTEDGKFLIILSIKDVYTSNKVYYKNIKED